jgi:hypothetical protein
VEEVPERVIFWLVTVYNKNLSSQCNFLAQIKQVQDVSKNLIRVYVIVYTRLKIKLCILFVKKKKKMQFIANQNDTE